MRFLSFCILSLSSAWSVDAALSHPDVTSVSLTAKPRFTVETVTVPNPLYHSVHANSVDNFNSTQSKFSMHIKTAVLPAPLSGCASVDFVAPVMLGSQGPFNLIIDTGSTTLAVATAACTNCGVSPLYTTNQQAMLPNTDQQVTSSYGDGSSWTGSAYTETVKIGGASASTVIASIDSMGGSFFTMNGCNAQNQNGNTNQGIMGYAYPGLALSPTQQFFSQYVGQGAPNVFTLQMCRNTGQLWHGGYDTTAFGGALSFIPIIPSQQGGLLYYTVNMLDVSLSSSSALNTFKSLGVSASVYNSGNAIVDSGTSLFALPTDAANALNTMLTADTAVRAAFGTNFFSANANGCTQPMNAPAGATGAQMIQMLNSQLPKLRVTLADANGNNPLTLTMSPVSSYLMTITDPNDATGNTLLFCPGYGGSPQGTIMGWSVINQFVWVHDIANSYLGIAPSLCSNSDPTSSPPGVVSGGVTDPNLPAGGGGTLPTNPPVTNPPATNAPATNAPATNAPATNAPATNTPATLAPTAAGPTTAPVPLSNGVTPPTSAQQAELIYWHNLARAEIARSGICGNMVAVTWDTVAATFSNSNYCPAGDVSNNGQFGSNWAESSNVCQGQGLCAQAGNCGGAGQPACEPSSSCTPCTSVSQCTTAGSTSGAYCTIKAMVYDGWYQSESTNAYQVPNNCMSFDAGGGHCSQVNWQNSAGIGCTYTPNCANAGGGTILQCNYNPVGNFNIPSTASAFLGACTTGAACSACPSDHPYCVNSGPFQGLCSATPQSGGGGGGGGGTSTPATNAPTNAPTQRPTQRPTQAPTQRPTQSPTVQPAVLSVTVTKGILFKGASQIPISFSYTAGVTSVRAWLKPAITTQLPTYLESQVPVQAVPQGATGVQTFTWTVPVDGTVPNGVYTVAVGLTSTVYVTAPIPITLTGTNSNLCTPNPCGANGVCSVNVFVTPVAAQCRCFIGYMNVGASCVPIPTSAPTSRPTFAPPTSTAPTTKPITVATTPAAVSGLTCLNGGVVSSSGTCICTSGFKSNPASPTVGCSLAFVEATQQYAYSLALVQDQLNIMTMLIQQDVMDAGLFGITAPPYTTTVTVVNVVSDPKSTTLSPLLDVTIDFSCDTNPALLSPDTACSQAAEQTVLNNYLLQQGSFTYTTSLSGSFSQPNTAQQVDPTTGLPLGTNNNNASAGSSLNVALIAGVIVAVVVVVLIIVGVVYACKKREKGLSDLAMANTRMSAGNAV